MSTLWPALSGQFCAHVGGLTLAGRSTHVAYSSGPDNTGVHAHDSINRTLKPVQLSTINLLSHSVQSGLAIREHAQKAQQKETRPMIESSKNPIVKPLTETPIRHVISATHACDTVSEHS